MDIKYILRYKNAIIALLIVVVFGTTVRKTFNNHSLQKQKIEKKLGELKEGEETIRKWKKLKADYKKIRENFLNKDTLVFKKIVEENARLLEMDITSLKISYSEEELYWQAYMQLRISCSYAEFIKFVKAIEEKSIGIEKVNITKSRGEKSSSIDLSLKGIILK